MASVTTPRGRRIAPAPAFLRRRIERAVERLIAALDALDTPDEDLEDGNDAEAEADEPDLGATTAIDQTTAWSRDRELDEAELSGIGDEDGYHEQHGRVQADLGATEHIDQRLGWGRRKPGDAADMEASGRKRTICW